MPTLRELIDQRINRIRNVPENLVTAIDKVNVDLFNDLVRLLGELETRGGNLVLSGDNLAKVEEIAQILQATMFDGDYMKAVVQFGREYGVQFELNKRILRAIGDFTDDTLFAQIMEAAQFQSLALLDDSAVGVQFSQPLKNILIQSISTEQRFSDAVDQLKEFIIGNPDLEPAKDGAWTKHAKQIAFDAFAITDRTTANIMADQNGYEWFRYDGTVKDTTRCFCRFRAGNIYHISEFEAWGERENIDFEDQPVKKLSFDDFETFHDAVAHNVERTAKIALDESGANYGQALSLNEIRKDLNDAGIKIEKVPISEMGQGNFAAFDGDKIKLTTDDIPLSVLLHEIGESVIFNLDKSRTRISYANDIFSAITTYGASRGNDSFSDNFYLFFLSPNTVKDLEPLVYEELKKLIPPKIKELASKLMQKAGAVENTLQYKKARQKTNCEITLKDGDKGWSGINDATNGRNIRNFLGGWNCRHITVAVPVGDVPASVKKRITPK